MIGRIGVCFLALIAVSCAMTSSHGPSPSGGIRYVALGDSYTIGTSAGIEDRFPNQLVQKLDGKVALDLVANLGVNGYTSADLIDEELPHVHTLQPGFVTVLIGVNDVVQGVDAQTYTTNVGEILDTLVDQLTPGRIVVVSVPDYTRTPYGSAFGDPAQQQAEIANFNSIMRSAVESRGIAFVDISPVAGRVGTETGLLADDGLHPNGNQYGQWADLIAPVVEELF